MVQVSEFRGNETARALCSALLRPSGYAGRSHALLGPRNPGNPTLRVFERPCFALHGCAMRVSEGPGMPRSSHYSCSSAARASLCELRRAPCFALRVTHGCAMR